MLIFYFIGVIISSMMGLVIIYKDKEDDLNKQYGIIASIALLSWIAVILFIRRIILFNK